MAALPQLFTPLTLRGLTIRNRAWVAPMCQYSAVDGVPNDWHFQHLASRCFGTGLIVVEATSVSPEGRISPQDTGIYCDEHVVAWKRVTSFMTQHGCVPAIQLAHAGRKASTAPPWVASGRVPPEKGGWTPVAPSPVPFSSRDPAPAELTLAEIKRIQDDFVAAARRSVEAGFTVVELHAAHGYLMHEFLSPLVNQRTDEYGGCFEGRARFVLETAAAVRAALPADVPLFVRISATDWAPEGGWDLEQSIRLCAALRDAGSADLIDVSSGGAIGGVTISVGPGYQVPFARAIREAVGIPTAAVGLITLPSQAEAILQEGSSDAIFLAREFLRDPYWTLQAAEELGCPHAVTWPDQYLRAAGPRGGGAVHGPIPAGTGVAAARVEAPAPVAAAGGGSEAARPEHKGQSPSSAGGDAAASTVSPSPSR